MPSSGTACCAGSPPAISLLPGQKMTLRADKVSFATDRAGDRHPAGARRSRQGRQPHAWSLLAHRRRSQPQTFTATPLGDEPGVFRVNFGKLPEGRYQARIAGDWQDVATRTVFDVRAISQEQLDLQVRPDLMARIAADSGGAVLAPDPPTNWPLNFRDHLQRSRPQRSNAPTAWDRPWVLAGRLRHLVSLLVSFDAREGWSDSSFINPSAMVVGAWPGASARTISVIQRPNCR